MLYVVLVADGRFKDTVLATTSEMSALRMFETAIGNEAENVYVEYWRDGKEVKSVSYSKDGEVVMVYDVEKDQYRFGKYERATCVV